MFEYFTILAIFSMSSSEVSKSVQLSRKIESESDNAETIKIDVILCAADIANNNFNHRKHAVIITNDVNNKYVDNFINNYKGSVIIMAKKERTRHVAVIIDSVESFTKIWNILKPDLKGKALLNGETKYVIAILSKANNLVQITSKLWKYETSNVVIVAPGNGNHVALYTFFPYKNHLDCHNVQPKLIGYWQEDPPMKINEMYPDKMANMHTCPLYITTSKIYNAAMEQQIPLQVVKKTILRLLRDVMNFTPIISTRDYVSIDSEQAKNWSDSLNNLLMGLDNISTCSVPLGIDRLGLLDYTIPYFRVRLAWIAPPIAPGPMWWRLLSPLNSYLWLILLAITFFVKSLPFLLKIPIIKQFCWRHFKNIEKLKSVCFRVWGVMVGQPIRVSPRRLRDFYLISLWMWFTFVVRSAYQSVLIGALKTDSVVGNFVNMKESIEAGYRYGGRTGILAHFEHDLLIKEDFEIIAEDKFESTFRSVIEGRKRFVIATSLEYAWGYCLAQGIKETECGHVLPDSIMTVPLVVWTRVHSPFLRPLFVWMPRFIESGLLEREILTDIVISTTVTNTGATPLTGNQMMSCVLLLVIGYIISITVFVLEIISSKRKHIKICITNFHREFEYKN